MTNREAYQLINALLNINPLAGTKLEHARNQTLKNAQAFIEKYNEKLKDLSIEFCSTDEKGHILRDQHGAYVYTKENERALDKAVKQFLNDAAVSRFEIVATSDVKVLKASELTYLKQVGFVSSLDVV